MSATGKTSRRANGCRLCARRHMAEANFLVVRLGSLGDIVHAFPAVAGLQQSFPNCDIFWLTHPKWEALVRAGGVANEVWTVDTRKWSSLRSILARIRRHPFQ